jgi:hypothetical protein
MKRSVLLALSLIPGAARSTAAQAAAPGETAGAWQQTIVVRRFVACAENRMPNSSALFERA